ncbi:leucine-rich repeats and immunoglobulin-like domains protein 1 [Littorina saxatilis]|uniref:leucine-rich repeats and immunoglobulin-like domains protein 1 n=1 Tax=Littorina saxatilis TaxID=31220 RepID=UPI0038B6270F
MTSPAAYQTTLDRVGSTQDSTSPDTSAVTIVAPSFSAAFKEVTVDSGGVLYITCTPSGSPSPTTTWFSPQGPVDSSAVHNGTLVLRDVVKNDTGFYTCMATNAAGSANLTVHLDVTEHQPTTAKIEGSPVTLSEQTAASQPVVLVQCRADGDPEPQVTWSRVGGGALSPAIAKGSDLMMIPSVGPVQAGLYQCNATNQHASAFAYFALYREAKTLSCDRTFADNATVGDVIRANCSSNCGANVTTTTTITTSNNGLKGVRPVITLVQCSTN